MKLVIHIYLLYELFQIKLIQIKFILPEDSV